MENNASLCFFCTYFLLANQKSYSQPTNHLFSTSCGKYNLCSSWILYNEIVKWIWLYYEFYFKKWKTMQIHAFFNTCYRSPVGNHTSNHLLQVSKSFGKYRCNMRSQSESYCIMKLTLNHFNCITVFINGKQCKSMHFIHFIIHQPKKHTSDCLGK